MLSDIIANAASFLFVTSVVFGLIGVRSTGLALRGEPWKPTWKTRTAFYGAILLLIGISFPFIHGP